MENAAKRTALAAYMDLHNLQPKDIVKKIRVWQPQSAMPSAKIREFAAGKMLPCHKTRLLLAMATGGTVGPASWPQLPMRTPLKTYMAQRNIGLPEMTQRIRRVRQHKTLPSYRMVSMWATGYRRPSHDTLLAIEQATEGEVRIADWNLC